MEELYFKTRKEWRSWLEKNHDQSDGIWMVYYKKNTKKPSITYDEGVEEALCFGWIDSLVKRIDDERYKQKYTPRNDKSVWSLINKERVQKMMDEGKMTEAGLVKIEAAIKSGWWDKAYSSREPQKLSDDLKKALKSNKLAWENWNNFSKSSKNMYAGWLNMAKRQETREKRIRIIVERSEKNEKPGMM